MAQIHAERLGMSDHSWVHMQIVLNIALRLSRLLTKGDVQPAMVTDHGMSVKDSEVVVAAGALLHDVGMSIHRADHEAYSLFLAREALQRLLDGIYEEPERSIVIAEALHAIIGHRRRGQPYTVEAGIVRVADALDMAEGRTRIPLEAGQEGIHSISAAAIDQVSISAGRGAPGPDRDRTQQLGRHLPGRRPAGDQDSRHPAGRSRRGRGRGQRRIGKAAAHRISPARMSGPPDPVRTTGIVLLPGHEQHETGRHPENAERIDAVVEHLRTGSDHDRLTIFEARRADEEDIARAHTRAHIDMVNDFAVAGPTWIDGDTVVSPGTYEVAIRASGAAILAVEQVWAATAPTACSR